MSAPVPYIFQSLQSVMTVLEDEKFKTHPGVDKIKNIYKTTHEKYLAQNTGNAKLHPFIVIEGLDGCGKTTLTKKLSNKLGAELMCTPPMSMQNVRHLFDTDRLLRTAYYAMGNYIAALEISIMLKERPVVLDRFWHSTAVYALAQHCVDHSEECPDIPPEGEEVYQWPFDLLKPDMVFLLDVSEYIRIKRLSKRTVITDQEKLLQSNEKFRTNVIKAYKTMENPNITCIDANRFVKPVLVDVLGKVNHLLL